MNKNKLKLNDDKTELMAVGDRIRLRDISKDDLLLGSSTVPFKPSAKYLGVHLDESLSMDLQISTLCCSTHFHLRKISSIKPYLSISSTAQLISSMILSRLDYSNGTLSGIPSSSPNRLQTVQNNVARLVLHTK